MKNKEWLKEQLSYLQDGVGESFNDYSKGLNSAYNTLERLIDQLDEPELPVIPQFVGDYIEIAKQDINLIRVFDIANNYEELDKWKKEYGWIRGHYEVFARAWFDGYTVEKEKEKLYQVLDKEGYVMMRKYRGDVVRVNATMKPSEYPYWQKEKLGLTEQEIKDYDERYWAFAEEVTD